MPSPGLRNRGQSLVDEVANKGRIDHISDTRTRLVAHRARQASGWEAAAGTLDARTLPVREGHERGHHLRHHADVVRQGRATPGRAATPLAPLLSAEPRYWLGACVGCERDLWVHTLRPRVPLCERCRSQR